jgi:hypothetical protein
MTLLANAGDFARHARTALASASETTVTMAMRDDAPTAARALCASRVNGR